MNTLERKESLREQYLEDLMVVVLAYQTRSVIREALNCAYAYGSLNSKIKLKKLCQQEDPADTNRT